MVVFVHIHLLCLWPLLSIDGVVVYLGLDFYLQKTTFPVSSG